MIDLYCERVGPGMFAEPLNALTNLFFIMAAAYCGYIARHAKRQDAMLLALLICAIGIGSAVFHTFATIWAQWLDVIPIMLFQFTYVWLYLRRILLWNLIDALRFISLFAAAIYFSTLFPEILNGSLNYLPTLFVLVLIGLLHYQSKCPDTSAIFAASIVFLFSLTARTIDNILCVHWPIGTHFIWHALNAALLALLSYVYIRCAGNVDRRSTYTLP